MMVDKNIHEEDLKPGYVEWFQTEWLHGEPNWLEIGKFD